MAFQDFDEFVDDTLKLPIGGTTFTIPAVDAKTGLMCQRLFDTLMRVGGDVSKLTETDAGALRFDDDRERDLYVTLLGPAHAQMVEAGVTYTKLRHAAVTTLIWTTSGVEAAEKFWATGGRPEARPSEPQDRKASAKKGRQGSRGGSTTTAAVKKTASRGAGSSSTGPSSRPTSTSGTASTSETATS